MSRGLSERQRRLLALLTISRRPLDVTREVAFMLGEPGTKAARVSLLRSVEILERRGLVEVERVPDSRGGGWPRVLVTAREGAADELRGTAVGGKR